MAFAVHRTQVEELIAERIELFLLREDVLERQGKFAKAGGFGPGAIGSVAFNQCNVRKKAAAPMRAFFETRLKLVREDAA